MVPANSTIRKRGRLLGKKIAIAGGPLDKSWLLLQGWRAAPISNLRRQASIVYGAPPLLSEKAVQGEHDATLTFLELGADLEGKGLQARDRDRRG